MNVLRQLYLAVAVAAIVSIPMSALAIGTDYKKPPNPGPEWWSPHLQKLVQDEHWVHGYLVNAEDRHFYSGSTEALNEFLQAYAQLDETRLEIVLHEGTKQAISPWNKSGNGPAVDWTIYIAPTDFLKPTPNTKVTASDPPTIARVDIWLGGDINSEELTIPMPAGMTVSAGKDFKAEGYLHLGRKNNAEASALLERKLEKLKERAKQGRGDSPDAAERR